MPCLLLRDGALVKTVKFQNPKYIGDPINAVRIYNEKEVDELVFLDITATVENRKPPFEVLQDIASECFMPVAYGGGVRELEDVERILKIGIEKIVLNTYAVERPAFISSVAEKFGVQCVVVSMDVRKKRFGGYEVVTRGGREGTGLDPAKYARQVRDLGAGEILLTSIERDGTQEGYDLELIRLVSGAVDIPVIASGGAGKIEDFTAAICQGGASACAAGSMVVYYGRNRAVLINFPLRDELEAALAGARYA